MEDRKGFTEEEIDILSPMEKIAVTAVKNDDGTVHPSLLTSLMPIAPDRLAIGEFVRGRSKDLFPFSREVAFAFLSLQGFRTWRGRARWTGKRKDGPELDAYKRMPMHRYNAYFPVHTVHYFDLEELRGPESFGFAGVGLGSLASAFAAGAVGTASRDRILKPYGEGICKAPIGLRFLAWIDADGRPDIVPVHTCRAADGERLILTGGRYGDILSTIPEGTDVSVFLAKLTLENIVVGGRFGGFRRFRGVRAATVDIERVYNSMPPNADSIYPPEPLKAVETF